MNKKLIITLTTLVPVVAVPSFITLLSSCTSKTDNSIDSNDKPTDINKPNIPVDKPVLPKPEKPLYSQNEISNLIPDKTQNANLEILNYQKITPTTMNPDELNPTQSNGFVNEQYFTQTQQYKQLLGLFNKNNKTYNYANIVKNFVSDFINNNLKKNNLDTKSLFSNFKQVSDNLYSVAIQFFNKTNTDKTIYLDDTHTEKLKPNTSFATKFDIDFSNVKLGIDQNAKLIFKNIKINSQSQIDNKNINLNPTFLNLNDNSKILNYKINNLSNKQSNLTLADQWIQEKLNNPEFINVLKQKIDSEFNTKKQQLDNLFIDIQSVADLLISNPSIKVFLENLGSKIQPLLQQLNMNSAIIQLITDVLSTKSDFNTISKDIDLLVQQNIIKDSLAQTIKDTLSNFIGSQTLLDWLLTLPVEDFDSLMSLLSSIVPSQYSILINIFNEFVSILRTISNNDISNVSIFDAITNEKAKPLIPKLLNSLADILPANISNIIKIVSKLWPEIQVNWTKENIILLLQNIFYPTVNNQHIKLSDFFVQQTFLTKQTDSIIPINKININIDYSYTLNFKSNLKFSLIGLRNLTKNLKLSTILTILNVQGVPSSLVDLVGSIGSILPKEIEIDKLDNIVFRIKDSSGLVSPTNTGYNIIADQKVQFNFTNSLDHVYKSLLSNFSFITKPIVKSFLDKYINSIKNFYLKQWYVANYLRQIKDDVNNLSLQNVFDGANKLNIDENKINNLKNIILPDYFQKIINSTQNKSSIDWSFTNELKLKVMDAIGVDNSLINDLHLLLFYNYTFNENASVSNYPGLNNISIGIQFNSPLLNLQTKEFIDYYSINNINFLKQ